MANYTNSTVSHARCTRLGTLQTSSLANPWSLGCALLVPLQVSLNYFLNEILEKRPHARLTNFFHRYYTTFDPGKLFEGKFFLIPLF